MTDNFRNPSPPAERRNDIDFLRVLAVLLLIYFHTAMIFNTWGFHIKNKEQSDLLTGFTYFVNMWHMPLLFLLSGASSWFALNYRTGRTYVRERFFRLFVPLVFGILVIIPPQVYLERLQRGQFVGSYLEFLPHAFNRPYPEGNLSWHHLWFLAYLFVYSLLVVPLFLYFKNRGRPAVDKLADTVKPLGMIFLWGAPLALYEALLRGLYPGGNQNLVADWANFLFYITVFIYGFLLVSRDDFKNAIDRHGWLSLWLAIVLSGTMFIMSVTPQWHGFVPGRILYHLISGFNTWFWLLAIMFLGRRYLNRGGPVLHYAAEASLPFYILHQTVIVVLGFYVVQWPWSIGPKFWFITTVSLIGSVLIYEFVVKRLTPLRFLFGMKRKKILTASVP